MRALVDDREAIEVVESALSAAVAARTVAEVPVGALLSGGIDSSLTVALMQQHAGRHPVRTFTVSFEEEAFDEAASAAAVAAHLGTEHTTVDMTAQDVFDLVPRVPDIWDEPFSDSSQLPTHLVAAVARRAVTVALSGDGGDELFAGYNRHAWLDRVWRAAGPVPLPLRRGVGGTLRRIPPGRGGLGRRPACPERWQVRLPSTKVAKLGRVLEAPSVDGAYRRSCRTGRIRSRWFPGQLRRLRRTPTAATCEADDGRDGPAPADGSGHLSSRRHPDQGRPGRHGGVARDADPVPRSRRARGSLAAASDLETARRHSKVDAAPDPLSPRAGKHLVDRPKMGFGVPIGSWLRGPLRPWAEDLLSEAALRRHGLLHPEPVRQAWELHQAKRRDLSAELWDVLMLQAWLERWPAT